MKQTENFGLNKPELSEKYDVTKFNENADIIDDSLKFLQDNLGVKINDEESNPAETYSSQKIEQVVENKFSEVDAKVSEIIDDGNISNGTTYSSQKIEERIAESSGNAIDDGNISNGTTYSSQKIESLIAQPIVVPIGQPSEIKQGNMWIEIEE